MLSELINYYHYFSLVSSDTLPQNQMETSPGQKRIFIKNKTIWFSGYQDLNTDKQTDILSVLSLILKKIMGLLVKLASVHSYFINQNFRPSVSLSFLSFRQ